MTVVKIEKLDLVGVIALVEEDPRGYRWMVGRCDCNELPYASQVWTGDFAPPSRGVNLATGQMFDIPQVGIQTYAHGATHEEALQNAYGLALERDRG